MRNPDVWTSNQEPIDLTGLSPYKEQVETWGGGALIGPRHLAFNAHISIGTPGNVVIFVDADNNVFTRTVVQGAAVPGSGDIAIAVLDSDVPEGITYYPIIDSSELASYFIGNLSGTVRLPALATDQEQKAITNDINELYYSNLHLSYYVSHGAPPATSTRYTFYESTGVAGDSGHPEFIIINNKPVLMLTRHTGTTGPYYGANISAINQVMNTLGGGYNVSDYDLSCFHKPPTMSSSYEFDVNDDAAENTSVGTASVDNNPSASYDYSLTGTYSSLFSIDPQGEITVASSTGLAAHSSSTITLGITATDADEPLFSTSSTAYITVLHTEIAHDPDDEATSTPTVTTTTTTRRRGGSGSRSKPSGLLANNQQVASIYNSFNAHMDLYKGIISDSVRDLQKYLNQNGFTLATTGPGSLGNETNFFGELTRQALVRFQAQHNIAPAIGYFGPLTRQCILLGVNCPASNS